MKITLELNDSDAEEVIKLLRRAVETVDRLDAITEDLQELRGLKNANKTKRRRPPVPNKR